MNPDMLSELYEKYSGTMYSAAYGILCDYHDASDAVQDTFLKLLTRDVRVDSEASARALLLTSVRNVCFDMLRYRRTHAVSGIADTEPVTADFTEQADSTGEYEVISFLPEQLRRTVELRFIIGMTTREVSAALGVKPAVVQSRVRRTRKLLLSRGC